MKEFKFTIVTCEEQNGKELDIGSILYVGNGYYGFSTSMLEKSNNWRVKIWPDFYVLPVCYSYS